LSDTNRVEQNGRKITCPILTSAPLRIPELNPRSSRLAT
jgi:hypothetical protein